MARPNEALSEHRAAGSASTVHANVAEAACEAWASCKPQGYIIEAEELRTSLPSIAAFVPGDQDLLEKAAQLRRFFEAPLPASEEYLGPASASSSSSAVPSAEVSPSTPEAACTTQLLSNLCAEEGQVHFLYFWRAFSQ